MVPDTLVPYYYWSRQCRLCLQPIIFHYLDGVGEWTEASSDTYNTQDVEYVSVDTSGCIYIASRSYTYCDEIPEQQEDEDSTQDNGMEFCYDRQ